MITYLHQCENKRVLPPAVRMMMVSDDCLVECKIDDDSDEEDEGGEQMNTPPPPPEFASKATTPSPKPPTPPTAPATPTPTYPVNRDPYGINQHLKVLLPFSPNEANECHLSLPNNNYPLNRIKIFVGTIK